MSKAPSRATPSRRQPAAVGARERNEHGQFVAGHRVVQTRNRHGQFEAGSVAEYQHGLELIPRGTIKSLYRAIVDDDGTIAAEVMSYPKGAVLPMRLALARAIVMGLQDPRRASQIAEQLADRLEGRPIQTTEVRPVRETVFYKMGEPLPPGVSPPRPIAGPGAPAPEAPQTHAQEEVAAAEATIAAAALETLDEADVPRLLPIDRNGYARYAE